MRAIRTTRPLDSGSKVLGEGNRERSQGGRSTSGLKPLFPDSLNGDDRLTETLTTYSRKRHLASRWRRISLPPGLRRDCGVPRRPWVRSQDTTLRPGICAHGGPPLSVMQKSGYPENASGPVLSRAIVSGARDSGQRPYDWTVMPRRCTRLNRPTTSLVAHNAPTTLTWISYPCRPIRLRPRISKRSKT